MKRDLFGINITKYVKDHEFYIEDKIENSENKNKYINYHMHRLEFLQHERFIHLVVMFMTLVALFLSMIFTTLVDNNFKLTFAIIDLILFILFACYIKHYFFLENHLQYWYLLYDNLDVK